MWRMDTLPYGVERCLSFIFPTLFQSLIRHTKNRECILHSSLFRSLHSVSIHT